MPLGIMTIFCVDHVPYILDKVSMVFKLLSIFSSIMGLSKLPFPSRLPLALLGHIFLTSLTINMWGDHAGSILIFYV